MLTHPGRPLLAAALALALAGTAVAAPVPEKPRTPGAAERLRKELEQTVTVEVTDQSSLEQAVNQFREQTKINLVLDKYALALSNIDPASVTVSGARLREVKARAALRSVLAPFNLHCAVVGDGVLITTEEMAVYRQLKQRVNLDLDRVELAAALKGLARDTGVNLVLDPRVTKEAQTAVTLQADDLALETAVRILAEMAGLKPVRLGNALYVTGRAAAADLRAEPELAPVPRPTVLADGTVTVIGGGAAVAGAVPAPAVPAPAPPPPAPKP